MEYVSMEKLNPTELDEIEEAVFEEIMDAVAQIKNNGWGDYEAAYRICYAVAEALTAGYVLDVSQDSWDDILKRIEIKLERERLEAIKNAE